MVCLSSFVRRLEHGGQSVEVELAAGDVRWLDAQQHSGVNIGSTPTETVNSRNPLRSHATRD
jgi:hypothetical protein